MRLALVVNPFSGGKKTKKRLPYVKKAFRDHGIETEIFVSRFRNHISEIAMDLDIHRYDAIVVMGGDGSNFHLINGLLSQHTPEMLPPLGILPCGSGNSFVRDLGIHSLEQGVRAITGNKIKSVDLMSYTQGETRFYFVNLMGFGFVTDVAVTAEHFKYLHDFSYLIGVLYRTLSLSFHHMELNIDGQMFSGSNCFVEFCNSRYTGGNMLMAPRAKIDDGLMDIVITGPLSKKRLLRALPKIYSGTHVSMDEVTYIQGKKAEILTTPVKGLLPDGEILGQTPGIIEVHKRKLRYFS